MPVANDDTVGRSADPLTPVESGKRVETRLVLTPLQKAVALLALVCLILTTITNLPADGWFRYPDPLEFFVKRPAGGPGNGPPSGTNSMPNDPARSGPPTSGGPSSSMGPGGPQNMGGPGSQQPPGQMPGQPFPGQQMMPGQPSGGPNGWPGGPSMPGMPPSPPG